MSSQPALKQSSPSVSARSAPSSAPAAAPAVAPVVTPAAVDATATAERSVTPGTRKRRAIMALVFGVLGLGVGGYWVTHRGLESTDDAQLDADVTAVPSRASATVTALHFKDNQPVAAGALLVELDDAQAKAKLAEAEAELEAARAASSAADATAELVETNAHAGKNIARASLSGAAASVSASAEQIAGAKASLASATSLRDKARLDLARIQKLVGSGALAKAELDSALTSFDTAQAAVDQAEARIAALKSSTSQARALVSEASARLGQASDTVPAQVAEARARAASAKARIATAEAQRDLAKLELSYTKIYAPRAGIVSKRSVAVGQLVSPGQTVVMIVPDARHHGDVWVTGNFKETQLSHMRVGQPATLTVDAYGRELHGHVESFSGATGARFALLPPDNATGNFTKVVQRVPVRVRLDDVPSDLLLLPGLSVELTVDTRL